MILINSQSVSMKHLIAIFTIFNLSLADAIPCTQNYIPVHEDKDLDDLSDWAVGGVFSLFANKAGFVFDTETYLADNPYTELFNFGFSTGKSCLKIDIIEHSTAMYKVLQLHYNRSRDPDTEQEEDFSQIFLRMAEEARMDHYLSLFEDP